MINISTLTLLSTVLGPPSALIGIADKVSDLVAEEKYRRNPEFMHSELMDQFYTVQNRAQERLEEQITNGKFSEKDNDTYKKLYLELRHNYALYNYINRPYNNYLSTDDFGRLIPEMQAIQHHYQSNSKAVELENVYTGYFFEEMAHFELLRSWYTFAINRGLAEKLDKIQEILEQSDSKISGLLNDTTNIKESVNKVNSSIAKNTQIIQEVIKIFDNVLLYLALAIIGTGIVFLVGILLHIKLEPIYLLGIPLCLLISELLVHTFEERNNANRRFFEHTKMHLLHKQSFLLILTILQTIIASTIIFIVSEMFSEDKNGNFAFWIIALLLGSFLIQIIKKLKMSKARYR